MIYLDHNATTQVLPEVFEAMRPYFCEEWGNPSSSYRFGSKLKRVLEEARGSVAELIGAQSREIIFTSCGTESNNAAIHAALRARPERKHIVTSQVEHSSVLTAIPGIEPNGHKTERLANTSNMSFPGMESEAMLLLLDQAGICASSGSACLADSDEPSHVVKAMKPDSGASRHMIRFSLGTQNTRLDVDQTFAALRNIIATLRPNP